MVAGMLAGAMAAAVLTVAGGGTAAAPGGGPSAALGAPSGTGGTDSFELRTVAHFSPPNATVPSQALTYDQSLVPAGARIEIEQHSGKQSTTIGLRVAGVKPGHAFGVHVHTKPCGADPAAAGGHYQNRVDPVQPSTDPAFVNPRNEVWLDFTANAQGAGDAQAHQNWTFRSGQARSVVLHDAPGTKGARVACLTVPFGAVGGG